jgi:hypothetical protein
MPVLGGIASAISGNLLTNSYESIATTITSTSPSSVTFSSIPQTYQHLQLRYFARRSDAVGTTSISIQLNGDGGANYVRNELYQADTTATTSAATGQTQMSVGSITGASANAGSYGVGIIDILDYANTNKNTVVRAITGANNNGAGYSNLSVGMWVNTAAVTSFTFTIGSSFVNNSTFALYGIKG